MYFDDTSAHVTNLNELSIVKFHFHDYCQMPINALGMDDRVIADIRYV